MSTPLAWIFTGDDLNQTCMRYLTNKFVEKPLGYMSSILGSCQWIETLNMFCNILQQHLAATHGSCCPSNSFGVADGKFHGSIGWTWRERQWAWYQLFFPAHFFVFHPPLHPQQQSATHLRLTHHNVWWMFDISPYVLSALRDLCKVLIKSWTQKLCGHETANTETTKLLLKNNWDGWANYLYIFQKHNMVNIKAVLDRSV